MKRFFAIAVIVIAAALWLYQGPPIAEEALKRHPASHVIRVTAKLTFDSKPVEFDELIDCRITYRGTPTSTPRMAFKLSRTEIATEIPGGGIIMFGASRSFCNVFGATWGSVFDEFTPPEGWTPVLEWYDHRDPLQAETGIIYLSETALEAEDGRLRVIEPFRISMPKYPGNDELIAQAERQVVSRDFWLGDNPHLGERYHFSSGRMEWMLRIPEDEWRNPERAVLSFEVGLNKRSSQPTPRALADFLNGVEGEFGVVVLGYPDDLGSEDITKIVHGLRDGRRPEFVEIHERGIAKRGAARHALLIADATLKRQRNNPLYPDIFDEYVPFTCIDGVMTPVPETPGLIYWFRDRCSHPDHSNGIDFFGKPIAGDILPANDKLVFDLETRDLWFLKTTF